MSYEILYDTQFIRSKSGITPAILSGSNNCTEVNWTLSGRRYERGERGWPIRNTGRAVESGLMMQDWFGGQKTPSGVRPRSRLSCWTTGLTPASSVM